jgi:hypothetical protein
MADQPELEDIALTVLPNSGIVPWQLLDTIDEYREQNKTVRHILRLWLVLAQKRQAPTAELIAAELYQPHQVNPLEPVIVQKIIDDPMFQALLDKAMSVVTEHIDKQALIAETLVTQDIAGRVMGGANIEDLGNREAALLIKAADRARARVVMRGVQPRAPRNVGTAHAAARNAADIGASNPAHLGALAASHRPPPPK